MPRIFNGVADSIINSLGSIFVQDGGTPQIQDSSDQCWSVGGLDERRLWSRASAAGFEGA